MAGSFNENELILVNYSSLSAMLEASAGRVDIGLVGGNIYIKDEDDNPFCISAGVPIARTATADGLTTGLIATPNVKILPTSGNAAHIITLPHFEVGDWLELLPAAANGYELSSEDPATVTLNNVTGGSETLAVAANVSIIVRCVEEDVLIATSISNVGARASAGAPN